MCHAELKDLVDGLGGSNAFHDGEDSLVDQRHQDTVGDEARRVVDLDWSLAELLRKGLDSIEGGLRSLHAANDFDELHHRYRIEEVHADDLRRATDLRGEFCDRDRAGVRSENGFGWKDAVEVTEESGLDIELFRRGLDGKVTDRQRVTVERWGDTLAGFLGLLWRDLFFGDFAGEVLFNRRQTAIQKALLDVAKQNKKAGAGADMGDAVAHGSGSEDCDGFDLRHKRVRCDSAV